MSSRDLKKITAVEACEMSLDIRYGTKNRHMAIAGLVIGAICTIVAYFLW
jgi:hypothetical protein